VERTDQWANGSLTLLQPIELLDLLTARGFTGRLVLAAAGSPRRVIAIHLDNGDIATVLGSGIPAQGSLAERTYRARQVLLAALTWSRGEFQIEALEDSVDPSVPTGGIGSFRDVAVAAMDRARTWSKLVARLRAPLEEIRIVPVNVPVEEPTDEEAAVLAAVTEPTPLLTIGPRCGLDEHRVLDILMRLAAKGLVKAVTDSVATERHDPRTTGLVRSILGALTGGDGAAAQTLKITVLSWDARTCFRTVEALTGSFREPPEDVEDQPRYHFLHQQVPLSDGYSVEVLGFRADVFEPAFMAPLVKNCHLFLMVTDIDAGHVWGAEKPLVDRIAEIREMFADAVASARITIGSAAETDHGCDVLIPEIGRFQGWSAVSTPQFLPDLLEQVAWRLGIEVID
jgi:hypothetical protein